MSEQSIAERSPGAGRWMGGLGIVYAILFALGFIVLGGSDPSLSSKPTSIINYYNDHHDSALVGTFAVALGTVGFAFFAGVLRNAILATGRRARHLCAVAMIGVAVYVGGLLLMAVIHFTLLDAAHYKQPDVAQVLNFLDQDDFFPTVAGLSIFMLAIGTAILRTRALPIWLGWFALLVGVVAMAGPAGAIAFLFAPVWTLCAAIVLLLRQTPISDLTAPRADAPAPVVAVNV